MKEKKKVKNKESVLVIDHCLLDIFVTNQKTGHPYRPVLTVAVNSKSKEILCSTVNQAELQDGSTEILKAGVKTGS